MDHLGLWIGVVALAISLYAAAHARRSAAAAERAADAAGRSARSAEEAVALEREDVREGWIRQLTTALPDGDLVESLLADLPAPLRPFWRDLVASAARRNPRTPPRKAQELLQEYADRWEGAVEHRASARIEDA